MTPDVQAAAERLRTFLDDIDDAFRSVGADPEAHRHAPVIVASGYALTIGDLHTLLAALDPADAPIDDETTARQEAAADAIQDLTLDWLARRHQPLTDQPIGHVPTPAGRQLVDDYRAARTQQRPKRTTGICANCGQTVYLEDGRIGWHPVGEDLNLRSCTGSGTRPKADADA